jgi:exodeoxyribonuclease III
MKLFSWNINGLRSVFSKGFAEIVANNDPDIICLQESKIETSKLTPNLEINGYSRIAHSAEKPGYSGVITYCKNKVEIKPKQFQIGLGKEIFDREGRVLITDHQKILLYNIYFPSGTTGEIRQNFKYEFLDYLYTHLSTLPKSDFDRLVICGDFNICHKEIDIHHPKTAEKNKLSGFLPEERKWMDEFASLGFIDTYRHHCGDNIGYTWWTFRAGARQKNLGWRIDYFFVANALKDKIQNASILSHITGSDHCPIELTLKN